MNGCDGALDAPRPVCHGRLPGHLDIGPERFAPSVSGSQARVEHEQHIA